MSGCVSDYGMTDLARKADYFFIYYFLLLYFLCMNNAQNPPKSI